MASSVALEAVSHSPKEDYNPLTDYLESVQAGESDEDEEDYDSFGSSLGYDAEFIDGKYGVTPPHNQRARRRNKEKVRAFKIREGKVIVALDKAMNHSVAEPLSTRAIDDVTIQIDSIAESPPHLSNISSPQYKKKHPKTIKHLRSQERDYKNISNLPTCDANHLPPPVQDIKIDSPNRYYSLHSKQIVVSPTEEGDNRNGIDGLAARRKLQIAPLECTKDRLDFYKTFSQLINMGNSARREKKDPKVQASPYVRQVSSEQAVWQNKLNDLIWLELQAWMSDRTMEEQDNYLSDAQLCVELVLDEVVVFMVQLPESLHRQCARMLGQEHDIDLSKAGALDGFTNHEDSIILEVINGETPQIQLLQAEDKLQCEMGGSNLTGEQDLKLSVLAQSKALLQVSDLLGRLEDAESLYPTTKALGKAHPRYASEEFQRRIKTLCVWMNVTRDLAHKLHVMAKMLNIDHMDGIFWPWLDLEGTTQLMRNIRDPQDLISPQVEDRDGYSNSVSSPTVGSMEVPSLDRTKSDKSVKFDDSECRNSDTILTLTPSDTSTPAKKNSPHRHHDSLLFSHASTSMSMEELMEHSIYYYFADRMLKKLGLRKMLERLKKIMHRTLCRARQGLLKAPSRLSYAEVTSSKQDPLPTVSLSSSPNDLTGVSSSASLDLVFQRPDADISCEDLEAMGLPSYKPTYLFLVRIPLNVVHECLRLRLKQKPETEPSLLSIRQLIRECKEVLVGSVKVKQYYQTMVSGIITDPHRTDVDLDAFEEDMKDMLEVYFNYLQIWMCGLQNLPEMSKRLKNALEEEWKFIKVVCPHVRGGEANASNRFCTMASSLLRSISDFLEREMDECIDKLYDVTTSITEEDPDTSTSGVTNSTELRQAIIQACRNFRTTFHEARERASKALGFAKMLRKDLEIAADFNIVAPAKDLLSRLEKTDHVRVLAPHSAGYLMFVPAHISDNQTQILHLLNVTCGREDTSLAASPTPDGGYLLLVKCEGLGDSQSACELWAGRSLVVEPTAETTIALSHVEVECLLLVVIHSSHLSRQRKQFEHLMGASVQMVSENTSCHQAIADSLAELKTAALDLREKVANAIHQVDEKLNLEDIPEMDEAEKSNLLKLYRETLHQCYNFGFEYHKEVIRLVSGDMRANLARMLIDFVKQWVKFVSEKCERGRGVRPRWATQGLEFLIVACEPRVLALLSDDEFQELKKTIYSVITHVIGDKMTPGSPSTSYRVCSPDVQRQQLLRNTSCPADTLRPSRSLGSVAIRSSLSDPSTPFFHPITTESGHGLSKSTSMDGPRRLAVDLTNAEDRGIEMEAFPHDEGRGQAGLLRPGDYQQEESAASRMEQVYQAVQRLEQSRTNALYNASSIGRVISRQVEVDYHINIRRVNFKWQRGFKIGEGQFGKVYTAINIDNGEMVAMKEIRFQPNDHQTIKDIADEIKRFEGISHPSLVKYYGVEIHRDEMLIFMEYCSEGTIAEVAKLGLPEAMVRKYTSELLTAINVLHESGIVHRDIKGANIFLHSSGLKLGDFGCSVQLKSHTTQPGEVKTIAGTTAYMAPEVITHNDTDGSGRAADIWSLGCVVIEMSTGKRPWHELDNNFMIMFKVGMGGLPTIPEHLSDEGKDFLLHCFESDPRTRWSAGQLQNHPFIKVYAEENADEEVGHQAVIYSV